MLDGIHSNLIRAGLRDELTRKRCLLLTFHQRKEPGAKSSGENRALHRACRPCAKRVRSHNLAYLTKL